MEIQPSEVSLHTKGSATNLTKKDLEMDSSLENKGGFLARVWKKLVGMAKAMKKNGEDDPRRIIHSLKMALALTLVSSVYCIRPLYDGIGVSGMWAVMTVVVVFEFTVGATISRCINRGFATLLAGSLGMGVQHFARLFGDKGEPIVLGISVFLLAGSGTFTRFIPRIKARYDYGILIFILTFSMVVVSGYRVEEIMQMASQRLMTVLMGGAMCLIICTCVCPIWAGQDLHILMAKNIEKLSIFLEGFEKEYFQALDNEMDKIVSKGDSKSFMTSHKSILTSKANEDSLANFMRWEPYCNGRLSLRKPWKQYRKIGAIARECAYQFEALSGYINSDMKIPMEFRRKIQDSCTKMSKETSKALKELSSSLKTRTHPKTETETHVKNSKQAVKEVENILKSASLSMLIQDEQDQLLAVVSDATVVSLLISVVDCVVKLEEAIRELAKMSGFETVEPTVSPETKICPAQLLHLHKGIVNPVFDEEASAEGENVIGMKNENMNPSANNKTRQEHVINVAC